MRRTFPVIWSLHDETHTGKLDVTKERIELTSRGYTFSFPRSSVIHFVVERDPDARIRGLASIKIRLVDDGVVRIASLGGAGSLHEISALLTAEGRTEPINQGLAGAGT